MRIGIIGAGMVGGTLGREWARRGHEVMFGVRAGSRRDLGVIISEAGDNAKVGTVSQAAAFGEAVVLATPWGGTEDALNSAGDLSGKIILDATNPLTRGPSGMGLATLGSAGSGGEQVAQWAPTARVVKVFNSVGFDTMADTRYGNEAATLLYCGDDVEAKNVAARLATDLGFDAVDAGPLSASRLLESFALLWVHLAFSQGYGRQIAFRLLRR